MDESNPCPTLIYTDFLSFCSLIMDEYDHAILYILAMRVSAD